MQKMVLQMYIQGLESVRNELSHMPPPLFTDSSQNLMSTNKHSLKYLHVFSIYDDIDEQYVDNAQ